MVVSMSSLYLAMSYCDENNDI